jgi:hypothetical protein
MYTSMRLAVRRMGSTHDYRIVASTTPPDPGLTFEFRDEQYTVLKLMTIPTI